MLDRFKLKSLGALKYFLGIKVGRSSRGIQLSQRKYTLDILAEAGSLGMCLLELPMDQNLFFHEKVGSPLPDGAPYRNLMGWLLYLTITRPDISFEVQKLSQFMSSHTDLHLRVAHHVLCYLKQAPGQG